MIELMPNPVLSDWCEVASDVYEARHSTGANSARTGRRRKYSGSSGAS